MLLQTVLVVNPHVAACFIPALANAAFLPSGDAKLPPEPVPHSSDATFVVYRRDEDAPLTVALGTQLVPDEHVAVARIAGDGERLARIRIERHRFPSLQSTAARSQARSARVRGAA